MRTDFIVERKCEICSKMVYFKAYKCKICKCFIHQSCLNSSNHYINHFCHNNKDIYNQFNTTNSVYCTIGLRPIYKNKSTMYDNQKINYWTELNYDKNNKLISPKNYNYSENIVYEQIPKKSTTHNYLSMYVSNLPKTFKHQYNDDKNNNILKKSDSLYLNELEHQHHNIVNCIKNYWSNKRILKNNFFFKDNLENKKFKYTFNLNNNKLNCNDFDNLIKKKLFFNKNNKNLFQNINPSFTKTIHNFNKKNLINNQKKLILNNNFQSKLNLKKNLISLQTRLKKIFLLSKSSEEESVNNIQNKLNGSFGFDYNHNLTEINFKPIVKKKFDLNLIKSKQTLTKAQTLSMQTEETECQKFLFTWPICSTIISKVEDLVNLEEEELEHNLSYKINFNKDIDEVIKEWCIPFKDIRFDNLLKKSNKSEIYRGHWHGDVLIYKYSQFNSNNEESLNTFKKEIAQLTKIRHENIMLFMGACIEPNNFAIITSMQKGSSLFECIHKKQKNFSFPTKLNILRQVAQAMGYLHARNIIHKKLSSNNIILENKVKICIMDQVFNDNNYKSDNYSIMTKGHLTYLSPELIKSLTILQTPDYFISEQYTNESDIYAFGTLLYELLNNKYPYSNMQSEQIIWAVGNGKHENVELIKCNSILKALLLQCWSFNPYKRPQFSLIVKKLLENVSLNKRHSSSEPERLNKLGLSRII